MPKKSFGKKLIEEATGVNEEPTVIDEINYSTQRTEELHFKLSLGKNTLGLLLSLVLGTFFLMPEESGKLRIVEMFETNWFFGLLLGCLPLFLLIISIVNILNRRTLVKINIAGVWTPDFELKWSDIVETKIRNANGRTTYLILKTSNEEYYIDLGQFNAKPNQVGHMVELFKKQYKNVSNML